MAKKKLKRVKVGAIVKGREGKPDYLKVYGDHVIKDGQYLNLESKAQQLANLEQALANKKLSADVVEAMKAKVNKIPDFVRFEVVTLVEE